MLPLVVVWKLVTDLIFIEQRAKCRTFGNSYFSFYHNLAYQDGWNIFSSEVQFEIIIFKIEFMVDLVCLMYNFVLAVE
jgi:hypothetical protein